ncbi:MAG: ATP-binding protein [Akkermansiaceae bacterium]|nr:ATP-binding protein [Verrucomicrobiales bacterium]
MMRILAGLPALLSAVLKRRLPRPSIISRVLLTILCGTPGMAASVGSEALNYTFRSWQAQDGLSQNTVTAVLQSRDGYVWAGTYGGLTRFDGVSFTTFDDNNTPELRNSRITCLYEARDGAMWIGHESGEVTRYSGGQFEPIPIKANWVGTRIMSICEDAAGDVWLFNGDGLLARLRDGLVLSPESGRAPKLSSMVSSTKGDLWVAREGRISLLEGTKLTPLPFRESDTNVGTIGMGASRDGGLWVVTEGRLRKWDGKGWAQEGTPTNWPNLAFTSLIENKDGILAGGTSSGGLFLIDTRQKKHVQFNRHSGFPSDWIISVCEDREGQFWVGTGGGGLVAVRSTSVRTLTPPDQWRGRAVLSVTAARDGTLWMGTEGAGVYRYQDGNWTNFSGLVQLGNSYVWSVTEDYENQIWIGTWGGGLKKFNGERFVRVPALDMINSPTPAILCSSNGSMWIGTGAGLVHYENEVVRWVASGPGLVDVRTICETPDGTIWFGMNGNGLGCLKDGVIKQFRKADGLSSDFIESFRLDPDGTLWIGTFGGGITRLKNGRFAVIDRRHGLANNVICSMQEDKRGNFWISSHAGIMRVSKAELNRCADKEIQRVQCFSYGMSDGLPSLECASGLQPASGQTADGHFWFPTTRGLVSIDPENVTTNLLAPPVLIEHMVVDDQPVDHRKRAGRPLEIDPGGRRFEFKYAGLSFVAPEKVLFRYRMEGLEENWVEAGTKRVVNYSFIPPGKYTFRVTACNNDGVWNETGAQVAFVVLPHFWQRTWFRMLVGFCLVALSGGIVWFETGRRMKIKLERIERERAIEFERARIAHDIHDDLGSQLTRITMLSESARGELDDPARLTEDIDRIYDTARDVTRAMDEIVWAVNPKHDRLDSLVSYLEKFGLDFLETAGLRCRLDMPAQFPQRPLTSEVRHNLFLAYKEALNNVVKHAAATEVRICFAVNETSVKLVVEDDGKGFDPATIGSEPERAANRFSGGNGLNNMKGRLEEVGGQCEISSAPSGGTRVTFSFRFNADSDGA